VGGGCGKKVFGINGDADGVLLGMILFQEI